MAVTTPNMVYEYLAKIARQAPLHPVLAFPRTYGDFAYYTAAEVLMSGCRAATLYLGRGLTRNAESPVVAIYAGAGIEWVATFVALVKLGHTVLALSPRLSSIAVTALMEGSGCRTIIHDKLPENGTNIPGQHIPIITPEELTGAVEPHDPLWKSAPPTPEVAFHIHSSGSTGIPKLIPKEQGVALLNIHRYGAVCESRYVASAVYNGVGLLMMLAALTNRLPTFFDNDNLPFSARGYAQLLLEARPSSAWFTPYSLELAASTPEGVFGLQQCKVVDVFGAVMPRTLGNKVVADDIHLGNLYGQNEVGGYMSSAGRPRDDKDWEHMTIYPHLLPHIEMRKLEGWLSDRGEQYYEMIVLPSYPNLDPRLVNCHGDDGYPKGSFRNGDMFIRHPTISDRWRIVGRQDDQFKIYTGDRLSVVNAGLYEDRIRANTTDVTQEVVLFGQGRKKLGLLVFPRPDVDPSVVADRVWATIQREINDEAMFGTKLDKDMVITLESGRTIPRTSKLNIIRPQVYSLYKDLIERVY